ncbi:MAG TPA: DUF1330 domain-containing protein [Acidobacteriaceae bacterium]|nr:DUF1330 domain-containing protein [Acidobacteriaceae bacterium]
MKGYFVFTREKTTDAAELAAYMEKVRPTFAGHDVKVLARYGNYEVLEGDATEGVVIVEFPSVAAAKAWYDSPEYVEVRKHRFAGSAYRAILVEGV